MQVSKFERLTEEELKNIFVNFDLEGEPVFLILKARGERTLLFPVEATEHDCKLAQLTLSFGVSDANLTLTLPKRFYYQDLAKAGKYMKVEEIDEEPSSEDFGLADIPQKLLPLIGLKGSIFAGQVAAIIGKYAIRYQKEEEDEN